MSTDEQVMDAIYATCAVGYAGSVGHVVALLREAAP